LESIAAGEQITGKLDSIRLIHGETRVTVSTLVKRKERQPHLALLLTQYVPDLHRVSRLQLFISSYACISAATGARSRCFKKVLAAKSECSPLSSVPTPTQVPPIQHSCLPCSCPWPCLTLAPHLSTSLEHLTNRPVCKDQECKAQPCALCKCSTLVTSACACA